MCVEAVGCLADGAHVDDASASYGAIEGDVTAAADDDVGWVVAQEDGDFLVVELVGERLEGIAGRAVDELEMPRAFDRDAHGGRELGQPRQDEVAQLGPRLLQAPEPRSLEVAPCIEPVRIHRGQGAIAEALDAGCVHRHQATPGLERGRAGEAEISGDEQAAEATSLGGGEHGSERVGVAVYVRNAQKQHRSLASIAVGPRACEAIVPRPGSVLRRYDPPHMCEASLRALASFIDPDRAPSLLSRYEARDGIDAGAASLMALLGAAYPAFEPLAEKYPEHFVALAGEGWQEPRDREGLLSRLRAIALDGCTGEEARARLRRAVAYEKLRIATRELLPASLGGAEIDVTAREISDLAEAAIEVALLEAMSHVEARFGEARTACGEASRFVVLGMGKLGGRELNVGSDVDLVYVYDTDDGGSDFGEGSDATSLHEHWAHVARRLTETLDGVGEEGRIFRADLRLRPEGLRGPLAISRPAMERYYESFGRVWERAALVRARPVAGSLALGNATLQDLASFIYARRVDPSLASEIVRVHERAQAELCSDPERDLKLGPAGIREAELFAQTLQLVFGGVEPSLRTTSTLEAIARLGECRHISPVEAEELDGAYRLLRRVEHRIQWATGLQTHLLPRDESACSRLARSLGFEHYEALDRAIREARERIAAAFGSLAPKRTAPSSPWDEVLSLLDAAEDDASLVPALSKALRRNVGPELARDLRRLARRPDDLLGVKTRESFPELVSALFSGLAEAADVEQAARFLRMWITRLPVPTSYVRPLGENPRALRRLIGVFGASAFLGEALANRPELGEAAIFSRTIPTPELAVQRIDEEISALPLEEARDPDAFVGALRRAAWLSQIEVALADLAGEIELRDVFVTLSALADATLDRVTRFVMGGEDAVRGLAILAIGKLGGRELGFGSDLDVLFVFDPAAAPQDASPEDHFARCAQRIIRLVTSPHAEGPGYALDTRLRPSGSHGLLVTSLPSFARYHQCRSENPTRPRVLSSGASWERQALLRARFCAGDPELGEAAMRVAEAAAYEREPPDAHELHRLRMRMEAELGRERAGRYDSKYGKGGLADIELAVQFLQMRHGSDVRVRTTETLRAIEALEELGRLRADHARAFRGGYVFLRQLEQRIRIVHGSSAHFFDEEAEGLVPLARRMGLVDGHRRAVEELVLRYREVTERVRRAYLEVLGVEPPPVR